MPSAAELVSDRWGKLGERCRDAQCRASVDSDFVVAGAQILDEGMAGDHRLRCLIKSAHGSQPALELTVIGFYRIVCLLLGGSSSVVMSARSLGEDVLRQER